MVHIEFYVFIIPKMLLAMKYPGGIEQFKQDIPNHTYQEDDQIATARFLRSQDLFHFINTVEEKGLHFDDQDIYSEDFAVYSFIGFLWECNWLQTNLYQIWLKGS
ncbi:hypothetical protein [Desertivirga xinjiangensis]|uniref:hypothetical protein n=1 Tax=Desertivirga xinjiangensis TaxID=539206 RepID=UPI0021096488|nr:hypothetical protein [Pedobacter xinjiangensis]